MEHEVVVDPRAEAVARVGGRFDARVLEPSPPSLARAPWFADDPVAGPPALDAPRLVPVPIREPHRTWAELAHTDDDLAAWCRDRWLGPFPRVTPPGDPERYTATRRALHALAEHVLAPARRAANGRIGLRYTRGGFGTPFFGADEQLRVEAGRLVVLRGGDVQTVPVTTVGDAARLARVEPGAPSDLFAPATPLEPDAPLQVDAGAAGALGDWFGFGCSALEELRAGAAPDDAPSRVQIWPEHFDISVDLGEESSGGRATFGASPGDEQHPEPYVYVTPWGAASGAFWNDGHYASLGVAALDGVDDQRAAVSEFFARARAELAN
jgi:hypothetical protein